AADHVVIDAKHRQAVKGQVVQEIDKGAFQLAEVAAVGVHVIRFYIGHHGYHGLQVQEGGIAFIRLGDKITAAAQAGVAAGAVEQAANHEGGLPARFAVDAGHQAGGGGFAVGAGHRHTGAKAHQLGQHFGPAHHRNAQIPRRQQLGVVGTDGGGDHHYAGSGHLLGLVAQVDGGAHGRQPIGDRVMGDIGAGNGIAFVDQHFGNTAHTGTADADKVDTPHPSHLGYHASQFRQFNLGH